MHSSADEATLLAADSFRVRVRDGAAEVRGFRLHLARFRLAAAGEDQGSLDAFLADARASIAAAGAGFPRLELWRDADGATRFACALRPLPALGESIELRSAVGDAPPHARSKGPNIGRYAALNRERGAEALLVGGDGLVREGATTSLIVWPQDEDGGGRVSAHADRVASVTERLIRGAAAGRPTGDAPGRLCAGALSPASLTVAELQRSEVWAVNALHGIRAVARIDGAPQRQPERERLRWFRDALERTWEPVAG